MKVVVFIYSFSFPPVQISRFELRLADPYLGTLKKRVDDGWPSSQP